MLTLTATTPPRADDAPVNVELPMGLVGFPQFTHLELQPAEDQGPFFWLRPAGDPAADVCFLVLESAGWIAGYELEVSDEDAEWLGITDPSEVRIFNIVTLPPGAPEQATVNLVGPILVRRENGVGKQIILANHPRFSATHPLCSGQNR